MLVAFFLLFFMSMIFGIAFLYLSARGVAKLVGVSPGSTLPHSVKRSIQEARQYGRVITRTVRECPPGPMRDRLSLTLNHVEQWLAKLAQLERGLAKAYRQRNLSRELRKVQLEIEYLRRDLSAAGEREAIYLHDLLESKRQHQSVLKELLAFQTQAELKIRKISSDLGATQAEILLIVARGDFNENRLHRLDENLQDHLSSMRDVLLAMDELGYSKSSA